MLLVSSGGEGGGRVWGEGGNGSSNQRRHTQGREKMRPATLMLWELYKHVYIYIYINVLELFIATKVVGRGALFVRPTHRAAQARARLNPRGFDGLKSCRLGDSRLPCNSDMWARWAAYPVLPRGPV